MKMNEGNRKQRFNMNMEQNALSSQPDYKLTKAGRCSPQNFISFNILDRLIE